MQKAVYYASFEEEGSHKTQALMVSHISRQIIRFSFRDHTLSLSMSMM